MGGTGKLEKGLIQVYTGNGKGKTTAAIGQAFRAAGHGLSSIFIHFMKGTGYAGELFATPRLFPLITMEEFGRGCRWSSMIKNGYVDCRGCGECFVKKGKGTQEDRDMMELALNRSRQVLQEGNHDLVILDELGNALFFELITLEEAQDLIDLKPESCELIITGRYVPDEILKRADLVTEMKPHKHPFDQGLTGRWGIEY